MAHRGGKFMDDVESLVIVGAATALDHMLVVYARDT
jgi:hypothetical protein